MKKGLKETLIGTWKLIEFSIAQPNGETTYPIGINPQGFIMYTPDGYMSAQLMKLGRPPYASKDMFVGTKEEMAIAAEGYMAYSGRFEADDEKGIVVHHMDVSMNPTWLGQGQVRNIRVEGNRIYITTNFNKALIIWERCVDNSNTPLTL